MKNERSNNIFLSDGKNGFEKTKEIWLPIPNYEGLYEISNKCRIKALPKEVSRNKTGIKKYPEKIKSINTSNQVCLFKDKKRKYLCVKKLYLLVFKNVLAVNSKYDSVSYSKDNTVIQTTQRNIVASAKMRQKTKKCELSGVSLNTSKGKPYQSCITIYKRNIHLGYFETEKEANEMYLKAVKYKYLYKGIPKHFKSMLKQVFFSEEEKNIITAHMHEPSLKTGT